MKLLNYLVSIQVRHCILNVSRTNVCRNFCSTTAHNECSVGSFLKFFLPSHKRNFMIYALTFSKKLESSDEIKSNKQRSRPGKKQGPVVSVIDENDVESVMTLIDAEKLARRKNLKLVLHQSSRKDKVKYKLEKSSVLTELKRQKEKDKKKIVLREETQIHDVEIKINQMMKFLDKGLNVICIIESSGNKESREKVLQVLEQSKLKGFLKSITKTKKGVQINYEPQVQAAEKEEDKENAQLELILEIQKQAGYMSSGLLSGFNEMTKTAALLKTVIQSA